MRVRKWSLQRGSCVAVLILVIHGMLLSWIDLQNSPVVDEVGHLAAGVYSWHFGRFDLYRVNPPLVRTVATLPVVLARPHTNWSANQVGPGGRPEWMLGQRFIDVNQESAFVYFTMARWTCIAFLILGGWICWRWASDLYGVEAGLIACLLWSFSPNVLAWGATICPDAVASAMGISACYAFWKWQRDPRWTRVLIAGAALGVAELSKSTWIVLYVCLPLSAAIYPRPVRHAKHDALIHVGQLALIMLLACYIVNVGYLFEKTAVRLGDYTFVSRTLAGDGALSEGGTGGNRFAGTWLGRIPIPLPENYLSGIDLQKRDFEEREWCYMHGEWQLGGWWYYYLYVAVFKVPAGTWCLGLMALMLSMIGVFRQRTRAPIANEAFSSRNGCWRDELTLLMPAAAVFLLVSSQTRFTIYFRYVLPCFPFLFVWLGKTARVQHIRNPLPRYIAAISVISTIASSLWCFPHSMSYFNEMAGGPLQGHYYLSNANIDWGQDLHFLKRWMDRHPEAKPLHVECAGPVDASMFGIESVGPVPPASVWPKQEQPVIPDAGVWGPQPGWYAISVTRIHGRTPNYRYFSEYRPVGYAGYSVYVFHISLAEANRVRAQLGLRPVTSRE